MSPDTTVSSCVYCGELVKSSQNDGDHVIPDRWGEFDGDRRFTDLCTQCHSRIDKGVEQLVRCGPESIFTGYHLAISRRSRRRGRGRAAASHGAKAPQPRIRICNYPVQARLEEHPFTISTSNFMVIKDAKGDYHQIDIFAGMQSKHIREKINALNSPTVEAYLNCDEQSTNNVLALLRDIWPNLRIEELPTIEAGTHKVRGQALITVTDLYFRAIAKTAFHYYLCWKHRGLGGRDTVFDELRTFILGDGDPKWFVPSIQRRQPRPVKSCFHQIWVDEREANLFVYIHFFVGLNTVAHVVRLGSDPSSVVAPCSIHGHRFIYEPNNEQDSRYAGRVEPLRLAKIPLGFWIPRRYGAPGL